jgi:cell division protein FtsQ
VIQAPDRPASGIDRALLRRARVRAVAAAIASDTRPCRRFAVAEGAVLHGSERRRRQGPAPPPPGPRRRDRRRPVAAAVLVLQLALLGFLLGSPAFRVAAVGVSGTRLLSTSEVLAAAGVGHPSVFLVDADAVAARVRSIPWVESAEVSVSLPSRVDIQVTERAPVLRVLQGGVEYALASGGARLRLTPAQVARLSAVPILIDERPAALRTPVSVSLMSALHGAAATLTASLGVRAVAFDWAPSGELGIWTSAGWEAVLGDLSAPGALSALPAELSALAALRGDLDLSDPAHPRTGPSFGYVNLVDPAAPAVGGTPGLPAAVSAVLGAGSGVAVAGA